ncbi:MAG: hypothetical protein ACYTXC_15830 [Nostoc sp.]
MTDAINRVYHSTQAKPISVGLKPQFFMISAEADFACVAANSIRLGFKLTA